MQYRSSWSEAFSTGIERLLCDTADSLHSEALYA